MSEESPSQRRPAATPSTSAPTRKQQKSKEELLKDASTKVNSAKSAVERLTVTGYWPTDSEGPTLSTLAHTLLLFAHTGKLAEMREAARAVAYLLEEEANIRQAALILQAEQAEREAARVLSQAVEKIQSTVDTALTTISDTLKERTQQMRDDIQEATTSVQTVADQVRINQTAAPSPHSSNVYATSAPIHPSRRYPPTQPPTLPSPPPLLYRPH